MGRHSPGPVASAHAPWEANCAACHRADAGGVIRSAGDAACSACHAGTGHPTPEATHAESCAACHREHAGPGARLTRPADTHCTNCHADLPAHGGGLTALFAPSVRGFGRPADHPAFRPVRWPAPVDAARAVGALALPAGDGPLAAAAGLRVARAIDPTRLRFNHALHLRPGLRPDRGGTEFGDPFTGRRLAAADRPRYQTGAGVDAPIQLGCASCHGFGEAAGGDRPDRPDPGAYPQPVRYEVHCRACHPLTADPGQAQLRVPHGVQPADLRPHLERTYLGLFLHADRDWLDRPRPARSLPGQNPDAEKEAARTAIRGRVAEAERYLYRDAAACGLCHPHLGAGDPSAVPQVVHPDIPEVWLPAARFSHHTHRAVECRGCHPGADPAGSRSAADVLIPDRDTCARCHGPAAVGDGFRGAAAGCTDCHTYHRRPHPNPGLNLSIDRFRRGGN